jgi:hypothetical protein
MFVRFRQSDRRLQASLTETRRQGGKVRHEHVAGLGSVPIAPTVADRIAFWTKLHQRLDALSNRVDAAQRGAILTAIHARVPMPTLDDHQAVQLERAQADARFWEMLADGYVEQIEGNKKLLATAQRAIAEHELGSGYRGKGAGGEGTTGKGGKRRGRQRHRATADPQGHPQDRRHD